MDSQAKSILERIGSENQKSGASNAIKKEIEVLEAFAVDLQSKADDNQDAIDEIDAALNDIEDAKKPINNGQFDDAKQKINDASST